MAAPQSGMGRPNDEQQQQQQQQAPVAVITTQGCPYCKKAKAALAVSIGCCRGGCDGLHCALVLLACIATHVVDHWLGLVRPALFWPPENKSCLGPASSIYLLQGAGIAFDEYDLGEQVEVTLNRAG